MSTKLPITKFFILTCLLPFVFLSGCENRSPKEILSGKSFYYLEACDPDGLYFEDKFFDNGFVEILHGQEGISKTALIPIEYTKEYIVVSDGKKRFSCGVNDLSDLIRLDCNYDQKREPQLLYKSLRRAMDNKPFCAQKDLAQ